MNNENRVRREKTFSDEIQSCLNTINQIFIILIGIYVTLFASNINKVDTATQMIGIIVGYYFLSAEALLCHFPRDPITREWSHRKKLRVHGIINLVGSSLILLNLSDTTWYLKLCFYIGIISLISGILKCIQPMFTENWYPLHLIRIRELLRVSLLISMGCATISLVIFTIFFK